MKSLEGISKEVDEWKVKHEELQSELSDMKTLRDKLNGNIVYLQNEIRKRDELLESSEFGDFEESGTPKSSEQSTRRKTQVGLLQGTIDDLRD